MIVLTNIIVRVSNKVYDKKAGGAMSKLNHQPYF